MPCFFISSYLLLFVRCVVRLPLISPRPTCLICTHLRWPKLRTVAWMSLQDDVLMRSARGDDDTGQTEPDQAAIDRAIAHMEMLMTSEDPYLNVHSYSLNFWWVFGVEHGDYTPIFLLVTLQEAAQVVAPASTFTLLGMALEEKPKLGLGAVASYKKAEMCWEVKKRKVRSRDRMHSCFATTHSASG